MAIAGKVAITPKGEWNAQTAYTKLDLVFYDNASYVAIQPSTGVEPTNESYWMLMVQSAGGADLEGIINGDIQVGNAKTLDGHEAEYFAPLDSAVYKIHAVTTNDTDLEALLEQIHSEATNNSIYRVMIAINYSGSKYGGGGMRYVEGFKYYTGTYGFQIFTSYSTDTVYLRIKKNGVWNEPFMLATLADLAKYLPNDGSGYMKGALVFNYNGRNVYFQVVNDGRFALVDNTNGKVIFECSKDGTTNTFNGTASGNLPLDGGGKVSGANVNPIIINSTSSEDMVRIPFQKNGTTKGFLGFVGTKPAFTDASYNYFELLHTGNKPTGTYTGNGDATERKISTGGTGNVIYIAGSGWAAFVTQIGAIVFAYDGRASSTISNSEIYFSAGVITIKTANSIVNTSGTSYAYQVL